MDSKIKIDRITMWDMVQEFKAGTYRIPRFQRDYVWDKGKVIKLLNSIYQEYPIGTFFLWEASTKYKHLFRDIPELNTPDLKSRDNFYFILDGQQRMTSLVVAALGLQLSFTDNRGREKFINFAELSFDLDQQEFTNKNEDNYRYVSLASILNPLKNMKLVRELEEERAIVFQKCYQTFSTYPLSVVYVLRQDLAQATDIFERINQGGVRLGLFDLVVASTWSDDFDLKTKVQELNKRMSEKGFGAIDPEFILQSLSLVLKGQATRASQLDIKNEELIEVWPEVVRAIESAVDHLRKNLGVKIYDFLPSRNMLPMAAYYFYKAKGRSLSSIQTKFLEDWFWICAFSEHYSGTTSAAMLDDRKVFDLSLENKKAEFNLPLRLDPNSLKYVRLYGTSSIKNGIICMLAQLAPTHFINNTVITLDRSELSDFNSPEKHHIFPRKFLNGDNFVNSIVNFCFIPAELNKEISDTAPSEYMFKYKRMNPKLVDTLKTHLIPTEEDSGIWKDDYRDFLNQRSQMIFDMILRRTGKTTLIETQLSDEPAKVVDNIEATIRRIVDSNLDRLYDGDYWKVAIPGDIQDNVKKRLNSERKRYPDQAVITNLELLSFCNLPDYCNIILKHWNLFEDVFQSKSELERNFLYLSDFRNAIKHNRKIASIAKKQGEASVEWFDSVLQKSV